MQAAKISGSEWVTYLNVEVVVKFDSLAESMNVLHHTGEFPHVSYLVYERCFLRGLSRWLRCLHLVSRPLPRHGARTSREGVRVEVATR
jgi:hypothetical protein